MSNLWLKIKVWTKISIFALVLIYVIIFICENNTDVKIWVWVGKEVQTNLLELIPVLLLAGVIGTLLVKMAISTVRQIREIKDRSVDEQAHKDLAELKAKAGMLQTKPVASATTSATTPAEESEHPPTSSH
jgi:uncharacterized integral membrane protein